MFGSATFQGVLVTHWTKQKRADASLKRLFMMSTGLNKDLSQALAILKPGDGRMMRMACDGAQVILASEFRSCLIDLSIGRRKMLFFYC